MKNNCCSEGCNFTSSDNSIEILIQQLKREVNKLMQDTTTKLLCQDKKIAETCVYIKNNLSNYLRDLLDSMQLSGELDNIIKLFIEDNQEELENKINNLTSQLASVSSKVDKNINDISLIKTALTTKQDKQDKMLVIGDSWSIEDYPYFSDMSNMWQHLVAKQLNLQLINYAKSGAGFTVSDNLFSTQLNQAIANTSYNKNEVKYIFVFGGINDLDFGTPSNVKSSCTSIINTLKTNYPKSQIIIMGCNTQVTFKKGDSNTTYNTMDITNMLQESAYENGVTFIDAQPFLYGITNTINVHEHPSLEGMKGIAYGVLSSLNSSYTRQANDNANASYTLTTETANAPSFIIQTSVKNNTLTMLFFVSNIVSKSSTQNYIYNIPEITLPYMNAEPLKNLSDGKQYGNIKVTSNNSKLVRISIDANYSGSLYFEKQIQI